LSYVLFQKILLLALSLFYIYKAINMKKYVLFTEKYVSVFLLFLWNNNLWHFFLSRQDAHYLVTSQERHYCPIIFPCAQACSCYDPLHKINYLPFWQSVFGQSQTDLLITIYWSNKGVPLIREQFSCSIMIY